ncbi:MAG: acyltransferase family protein [Nocardioides sp.]
MRWGYRPALDGLRTVAVYLVVLFHAGVGFVGGGYIGVDLFFVLSGFLVSTILFEELERTGRLDLANFYDRRVRRLLPAAVLVVLASCAASLLVLSTLRRVSLIGDAQSALLYVANWRFLLQSNDYFGAADVDGSLFLHFWSLSIEEQFYFFFPILLVGLTWLERRRRGATAAVLSLLFLASLGAQLAWAGRDANHAYYGTDARLYQLVAGVLLAMVFRSARRPRIPVPLATCLSLVLLAGLLLTASSALDVSVSQRGLLATALAVGLVATLASESGGLHVRLFSLPALVYLGKISYGTYLWHWPVIVLLREVVDPPALARTVLVVVLSTSLAAASFHMLERPIRSRRLRPALRIPAVASALSVSLLVALLVVPPTLSQPRRPDLVAGPTTVIESDGNATGRVPAIDFAAVKNDKGPDPVHCEPGATDRCAVVTGRPGPHVVLVGDSHGQMLAPAMTTLAEEHGFNLSLSLVSGCPWQVGVVKARNTEGQQSNCADARAELYDQALREMGADIVFLTQRTRDETSRTQLTAPPGDGPSGSLAELLVASSARTFDSLRDAGVRSLVFQGVWSLVEPAGDPLECLATASRLEYCRVVVDTETGLLDSIYRTTAARSEDVFTVDINPFLCPKAPVCDPVIDGVPVWRDKRHYTPAAILGAKDRIWAAIRSTGVFDGLG